MSKRCKIAALGLMLASFAPCAWTPGPEYTAKGPIEAAFMARGPWQVSRANSAETCTSESQTCDIWARTGL